MSHNQDHIRIIDVSVAQLWVSITSPREIDTPVLQNPVLIKEWISSMTTEQKKALSGDNLLETQALYGTVVEVIEEQGDWSKVVIPEQPTLKSEVGYPGWLPTKQLTMDPIIVEDKKYSDLLQEKIVVVTSQSAHLFSEQKEAGLEISFLTRLPYLGEDGEWIQVATPSGIQFLKKADVSVYDSTAHIPKGNGELIVEQAKRFLDLPYLWSGMSGFGFDCSGFSYSMHRYFGITTPRDASDQSKSGQKIEKEDLKPGDMIFFAHQEGKGRVHHVGLYIGNDQMIHSPNTPKTIEITTLTGTNYEKEYCGASRYWE